MITFFLFLFAAFLRITFIKKNNQVEFYYENVYFVIAQTCSSEFIIK